MRTAALALLAVSFLFLAGCNTTSTSNPEQRSALHGPPLTEAELIDLAHNSSSIEDVTVEVRLRGFAFSWDAGTRSRLSQAGLQPPLIERLANIAGQPDTLGNQPRPDDALMTAVGVTAVAAAITGLVFLIIEIAEDDDDHYYYHGHRYEHW